MRCSESERGIACPASLIAPQRLVRGPKVEAAANYGTLVHHWAETGETNPTWADPRHVDILERKLLLSGISRETYFHGGESEVTFAVHIPTLEIASHGGARYTADAWKRNFDREWLTGTIDYLYEDGGVRDLKTGRHIVSPTAPQLRSYMLLTWIRQGHPFSLPETSIVHWPMYPLDGLPTVTYGQLNGIEMWEHVEGLRHALNNPNELIPGEHCRFCGAKETYKDETCKEAME